MLRGRGRHRQIGMGQRVRFPPIELGDPVCRHAPRFEMRADAERGDKRHVTPCQLANGRVVEMIVVIVGDEHHVHGRQCAERNRDRLEAFRTREPGRRRARSPDRVGQYAQPVDLDQHRGMAKPRRTQPGAGCPGPGGRRIDRRERCARNAPVAAAEKLRHRRWPRRRVAQPGQHRVDVAKRVACPKQRGLDALEAQTFRTLAE